MTRVIDERFLKVHPRTALWWEQRELCRKCANFELVLAGSANAHGGQYPTTWRCNARSTERLTVTCMDMRDPGSPCGPEARLFIPGEVAVQQKAGVSCNPPGRGGRRETVS